MRDKKIKIKGKTSGQTSGRDVTYMLKKKKKKKKESTGNNPLTDTKDERPLL